MNIILMDISDASALVQASFHSLSIVIRSLIRTFTIKIV